MEISAFQELEIGVKSRERPMLLWSGFINDFCSDKTSHYPDSSGRCVCVCEAKNPALLSSRDGYLLGLTGWTKGSQASWGVWKGRETGL